MTEPTVPMPHDSWEQPTMPVQTDRPPRRRRRGTKWLIALVILLGLLVGADRIALLVAEDQLAGRIQSSQHLSQKPGVSISGFPFLTQVISRDFPHATVDIHGLTANTLTITDLHADLHGVHVNGAFNGATVDSLTATAQISYSDIAKALSSQLNVAGVQVGAIQVTKAGNDQIKATYDLLGATVSAIVDVSLADANTLEFKSVSFDTPLSGLVTPSNFDVKYNLGSLPFGMNLTQLTFTASEVDISATGSHVNLSQSTTSGG
ncbi:DUF2993 domain-containing protein [Actinospica sp.]|uniref:LmeA family phospholipid-binding protein n=1 Tax=Actinospica sp. TaxID=1872142 RepID=UPI002BAF7006|nr:DUF2993 domain-containing protein [Actinospica sp.]HWG22663.1 DUF2993 domain-containing protein [Actinospica sp.]